MSLFKIRTMVIGAAIGMTILIAGSNDVSAQTRREIERERQRIEREQQRIDRQRRNRYRNDRDASVSSPQYQRRIENAHFMQGYQYGIMAGEYDRRKGKYNQSNVYRDTGSYPNSGDPTNTDYMYRQGYLQGYEDGFYGRRNY